MAYDTQIIYGDTRPDYNNFILNGFHFYTTKKGIRKFKIPNCASMNINEEKYNEAWDKYYNLFIN